MAEGKKQSFKINDQRRFDSEGQEKDSSVVSESTGAEAASPDAADGLPKIDFSSFLISLATQALMQLGEMQPPTGVEIPIDRVAAQQTIDIINMLKEKTSGNLDSREERLIEEVLHNLHMSFIGKS